MVIVVTGLFTILNCNIIMLISDMYRRKPHEKWRNHLGVMAIVVAIWQIALLYKAFVEVM